MGDFNFKVDGIDELETDFKFMVNEYPKETRREVRKLAREFKISCIEKTPNGEDDNKADKKLINRYGITVKIEGDNMVTFIHNAAPHFHLIELGHKLVKKSKVIGWVPGKFMMKKTRDEYDNKVPERLMLIRDKILK